MKFKSFLQVLLIGCTALISYSALAADTLRTFYPPYNSNIALPLNFAPFSGGIKVGGTLYVAGLVGVDLKTMKIPQDINEETRLLFQYLKDAFATADMSLDQITMVQVGLSDPSLLPAFNREYVKYFSKGKFPARLFMTMNGLGSGAHFEINAIGSKHPLSFYPLPASIPLPLSGAVKAGDTVYLSGFDGRSPKTGKVPTDIHEEVQLLMDRMKSVLAKAGMTMDQMVMVNVFCTDDAAYKEFNNTYLSYFHNKKKLPARSFVTTANFPSLNHAGAAHFLVSAVATTNPNRSYYPYPFAIPLAFNGAVKVGNVLYIAGLDAMDRKTMKVPTDIENEVRVALEHMKETLASAGMTMEQLVSVTIYCTDKSLFKKLNAVYLTYFNDKKLPTRSFFAVNGLPGGAHFEIVGIAVK